MRKPIVGLTALTWLMVVSCADVPRSNKFDVNAPLSQQALGLMDASVDASAANPNDPAIPVGGATVKLTGPTTTESTTDPTGNAVIDELTPGNYNVLVSAAGYYDNVDTVTIVPGQEAAVQITLHVAPQNGNLAQLGSIVGVVAKSDQLSVQPSDNSGITAATVDPSEPQVSTTTDVNGEFTLQVMPGPHTIQVSAPGYSSVTFTNVYVSAGNSTAPCNGAVILQKQN